MKEMKKISRKNLPATLPLFKAMFLFMFMDYYNAPEWLWGIVIFLALIVFGLSIYSLSTEKLVDLFEGEKTEPETQGKASTFKERLKQEMDKKNN